MKIKQIALSATPETENRHREEWLYALCENGQVVAKDVTDSLNNKWNLIGEVPDEVFPIESR